MLASCTLFCTQVRQCSQTDVPQMPGDGNAAGAGQLLLARLLQDSMGIAQGFAQSECHVVDVCH